METLTDEANLIIVGNVMMLEKYGYIKAGEYNGICFTGSQEEVEEFQLLNVGETSLHLQSEQEILRYADSRFRGGKVPTHQQQLEALIAPSLLEAGEAWFKKLQGLEVDAVPATMNMAGTATKELAAYYAVNNGPRIIEVSQAECDEYSQIDLHRVDPKDFRQSFPLVLVKLPENISPRLIGSVCIPELGAYCNLFTIAKVEAGVVFHDLCHIHNDFEQAFGTQYKHNVDDERPDTLTPEAMRIAIIAILQLVNNPEFYLRYNNKVSKIIYRKQVSTYAPPKRCELIPQVIRLNRPLSDVGEMAEEEREGGTGSSKSPHTRRGYMRVQRVGPGRTQTKVVMVKSTFVNSKWILRGAKVNSSVYSKPK